MRDPDSALFTATAIPAGVAALAVTAGLALAHGGELSDHLAEVAVASGLAVVSSALAFTTPGRDRASLELAYTIAALLALPFPAAMVLGAAAALAGSLLRGPREAGAARLLSLTGANVAVAVVTTGAASALAPPLRTLLNSDAIGSLMTGGSAAALASLATTLCLATALYVAMNGVNLALMAVWVAARGQSPHGFATHLATRIVPLEIVTIPFASSLAFALRGRTGLSGFALLGCMGLCVSWLLHSLGDSRERLRLANLDLEERLSELAMLNSIGREISAKLDPRRVFETVRRECRKVLRPDFFWIARYDVPTHEVRIDYSMAGEGPPRAMVLPLGKGLVSYVIETETPLLISDAVRDPRMKEIRPIVLEPKIRSVLAVPLMVESRVIGVLSVQSYSAEAYDQRHVSLLSTIGQQAAITLENARHYQLATVDQLTGLFQRDYFTGRMDDEYRRSSRYGTPFSLMMMDLDSFKRINDAYGHLAGDRFLRAFGDLLRTSLRGADVPCRHGGEEFAVLLPETDLGGARAIAERLRESIASLRVEEGAHTLGTTVSIGIVSYPIHFEGSLDSLMRKADESLYEAKRQGKDRVVVADV